MASEALAPKKSGLDRGPNHILKAPTNPDDRTLTVIRPPPDNTDFADNKIVKSISQLCLQNWPTPAITWAGTPPAHKDAVWAEFQKRYRWADEQGPMISTLFWQKCAIHTKDNLNKEREKAIYNAGIDHPGNGNQHMHEYNPWWCSADIWAAMCDEWRSEGWVKKRGTSIGNRCAGVPSGAKAKDTYKGGSISQMQHIVVKESQGTPLDVYMSTRDGLPDAVNIAATYRRLLDERYPEGTNRPHIDQELWERASIVKKNFVKGQGQCRRPSFTGSGCSSQSSSTPFSTLHTPADCVRAICQDRRLLRQLGGYLGTMDSDELAEAVAEAAASQQHENGSGSSQHHDRDDERQNWQDQSGPSLLYYVCTSVLRQVNMLGFNFR